MSKRKIHKEAGIGQAEDLPDKLKKIANLYQTDSARSYELALPMSEMRSDSDAGVMIPTTPKVQPMPKYALCPPMAFVKVAAFLGAAGVTLGAYGAHVLKPKAEMATVFHTANLYHFLHTLLLFTVGFSRYPKITGFLITLGTIIFSGTCYLYVFTDNHEWVQATPYGGMLLIAGWITFLL